jgi:hypothetical protein
MRNLVLGMLFAALGLAATFVYAEPFCAKRFWIIRNQVFGRG